MPDQFEGTSGNDSLGTATQLSVGPGVLIAADVGSHQDADFYQLTDLQAGSTIAIRLQTQGVSLLEGRITIFKDGVPISTMTPSDINQNIKLIIPNIDGNSVYTVEVQSGSDDVFGIGSYQLVVKPATNDDPTADAAIPVVDHHSNDSFGHATSLVPQQTSTISGNSYSYNGVISTLGDVDYYNLNSSQLDPNHGSVMTVMVWAQGASRVDPIVTVYDQNRDPVSSQILVNQKGEYVLQIADATSAAYYIKIKSAHASGSHATGDYFLGVQYGNKTVQMDETTSNSLTASSSAIGAPLQVADTRLLHFSLAVAGATSLDAVRLTVFNQNLQAVTSVYAATGNTVTFNALLTPGTYYLGLAGGQLDGASLSTSGVTFTISYIVMSDPIDPAPTDPVSGGSSGGSSGSLTTKSGPWTPSLWWRPLRHRTS